MQARKLSTDGWADGPKVMKKASFVPAVLSFSCDSLPRRIAALLIVTCFVLGSSSAQANLPKNAVSIPQAASSQPPTAFILDLHPCIVSGSPVVLPPVHLQMGVDPRQGGIFNEQAQLLKDLPADAELWLHIVIDSASNDTLTEQQVTDQVNSFLGSAPLTSPLVRGVILEPSASQKISDLYLFSLLRLALNVKSINPSLRLAFAFQPGFINLNGSAVKRLATYSDLLGTTYSPEWRADAAWIAANALNKPLILKLDSNDSAVESYLNGVLAASGSTVEMLWSGPSDVKSANQLCAVHGFLAA
jgi:hypothetical protein